MAAYDLKQVGVGDASAVSALLHLLCTSQDDFARAQAAHTLKAVAQDNHLPGIVSRLKDCLSPDIYATDLDLYGRCYDVIWHCARTMSYQAFYQAWYAQSNTDHPEVSEQKGVGSNSITRTLNLADLPSLLAPKVAQDSILSQTAHLICIDGSKFIDPDNPAAEIYLDMLEQGCPERLQGEPTTMQAFKIYWKQLKGDKRRVLVFYTAPTQQEQPGFSPLFLTALSRCGGAISVITEQPLDHLPLKYFSSSQPTLVEDIIGWVRQITLEYH